MQNIFDPLRDNIDVILRSIEPLNELVHHNQYYYFWSWRDRHQLIHEHGINPHLAHFIGYFLYQKKLQKCEYQLFKSQIYLFSILDKEISDKQEINLDIYVYESNHKYTCSTVIFEPILKNSISFLYLKIFTN